MKRNLLILLTTIMVSCSFTGCGTEEVIAVNVNVDNTETSKQINNNVLGSSALKKIGNGLWYDTTTGIVYWWNGYMNSANWATVPTAYYSPNGLLYRYIPETNTLEEIKIGE